MSGEGREDGVAMEIEMKVHKREWGWISAFRRGGGFGWLDVRNEGLDKQIAHGEFRGCRTEGRASQNRNFDGSQLSKTHHTCYLSIHLSIYSLTLLALGNTSSRASASCGLTRFSSILCAQSDTPSSMPCSKKMPSLKARRVSAMRHL